MALEGLNLLFIYVYVLASLLPLLLQQLPVLGHRIVVNRLSVEGHA